MSALAPILQNPFDGSIFTLILGWLDFMVCVFPAQAQNVPSIFLLDDDVNLTHTAWRQ